MKSPVSAYHMVYSKVTKDHADPDIQILITTLDSTYLPHVDCDPDSNPDPRSRVNELGYRPLPQIPIMP